MPSEADPEVFLSRLFSTAFRYNWTVWWKKVKLTCTWNFMRAKFLSTLNITGAVSSMYKSTSSFYQTVTFTYQTWASLNIGKLVYPKYPPSHDKQVCLGFAILIKDIASYRGTLPFYVLFYELTCNVQIPNQIKRAENTIRLLKYFPHSPPLGNAGMVDYSKGFLNVSHLYSLCQPEYSTSD